MVRTKIEINTSSLGQRSKSMNVIVGSKTTSADVKHKVLEKCRVSNSPSDYQLWTVAKGDKEGGCMHIIVELKLQSSFCSCAFRISL